MAEAENTIWQDFIALQQEIKNPDRSKEVTVKLKESNGSYKFKYAPLDAILNDVRPILLKHNFALTQGIVLQDGKKTLETSLIHKSGEMIKSFLPFPDTIDNRIQDFGGKLTYFKRYGLCMALAISAEDDTDAQDTKGKYTKGQVKTQIGNYVTEIAKAQSMQELMRTHGEFKEILDYAKTYFPNEVYEKSGDGMCAQEYFEFLYKSFRDTASANDQMDQQYKNTVSK